MMADTVRYTQSRWPMNDMPIEEGRTNRRLNAIAHAAVDVAHKVDATVIVAETHSGATAARIAACRPELPIIAVAPDPRVAQQLALSYATRSFVRPDSQQLGSDLTRELLSQGAFGDVSSGYSRHYQWSPAWRDWWDRYAERPHFRALDPLEHPIETPTYHYGGCFLLVK